MRASDLKKEVSRTIEYNCVPAKNVVATPCCVLCVLLYLRFMKQVNHGGGARNVDLYLV
jgi:hypothetical protein